jgi:hypothetical protein
MSRLSLSDVQQSFVRRYMTDSRILGVRVRRCDDIWTLDVEIDAERAATIDLPGEYRGIPVRVRHGVPAVLAYAVSCSS